MADNLTKKKFNFKMFLSVAVRYVLSVLFIGLLVFLPAGTLKFRNAWIFMTALFIPMLFVMIYFSIKDPEFLLKRMKTKEKEKTQKIYLILSIILCFFIYAIPGIDFRYHWSNVPLWVIIAAAIVMLSGYFMFFSVMRQNSYASRVIEIQNGQKVIDTGLYSVIRHPMYLAGSILFCSSPLVLGSYYALIPAAFMPVLLVIRLLNEEKFLKNNLAGYEEYMKKVRYRLLPFIW